MRIWTASLVALGGAVSAPLLPSARAAGPAGPAGDNDILRTSLFRKDC